MKGDAQDRVAQVLRRIAPAADFSCARFVGAAPQTVSPVAAMFQIGGTLGAIVVGWLMDRFEPHAVLCGIYAAGALSVILISVSTAAPAVMTWAVFAAGLCISGGQVGAAIPVVTAALALATLGVVRWRSGHASTLHV